MEIQEKKIIREALAFQWAGAICRMQVNREPY
jgi:hypothetical protein